ncbi:MAG: hypothetical protein OEY56_03395 [Cyclobacteriaceae bacterium]|nr:hypothetical protein [Cyclobacteriaceae bacterium]
MKRIHTSAPVMAVLGFVILLITGCNDNCESYRSYIMYEPVYATTQELKDSVEYTGPVDLNHPGKIYFMQGYIFINEAGRGIHVIDNRDVAHPQNVGFIEIPGNFDLAAQGNFLYADSYVDLIVFDISDKTNIHEINRVPGVFTNLYSSLGMYVVGSGVVVNYEERLIEESGSDCMGGYRHSCFDCVFLSDVAAFNNQTAGMMESVSPTVGNSTTGIGGSMARFTITDNHLFTLDNYQLRSFDITNQTSPVEKSEISVGWGMETIFPYNNHLFLGSQTGMHIYSLANADAPSFLSTSEHIRSCDPVVVQGDYAYVTLRNGSSCGGFTNQLDVIDISNLSAPKLFKTFPMSNPHGLGIDGNCLFICEGDFGLKFFDATDVSTIGSNLIKEYPDIHALDVIPYNNVLMMIGSDGFYQYNYNCTDGTMDLLSFIAILAL